MKSNFVNITFRDFVKLQRGFDLTKKDRKPGPFPVVASTSIQDYHFEYKVEPPGVVTGRSGSLGTVQFIEEPFWPLNTSLWVKDFKGNDPRFVFFFLKTLGLERYNSGAGVPTLNRNHLDNLNIAVPPLPTQRKIAAILSAYDDLIENNLRRIKILEEMAQNLYREWFVKFRFPGHEKARFVDSPFRRVPEGWEVVSLLDIADVTYGFAFDSKKFSEDKKGTPVVRIRNIIAGHSDTFSEEVPDIKYTVRNGDILVGMDGDFHMGFWTGGNAWLVQRVARFHPKREIGRLHLFLALQQPIRHFNATITGTTVAHLGHKHIKTIKLLWPNKQLLEKISSILNPILDEFINLRLRNKILRRTRDLLLPKLISGEIDVSNLTIQTDWPDKNDIRRYDFFQQICRLPFVDKIVLFGSRARGDHHDRSDIDLAIFCDQASDEEWQQVLDCLREDRIDTLLKVDCVRFERINAALKEHIMIEGKVLYEKSGPQTIELAKKRKEPTRMSENKLANHLSNSQRCLQRLDDAIRQPLDEDMFMLDAVVHRFNIAFELLMDTLLVYCVETDLLPKEKAKEYELNARKLIGLAFDCKLIDDDQTWIAIKDARNATAHEYDEQQALAHYNKVKSYLPHLQALFKKMNTIADDVAEDVSYSAKNPDADN
ncbi:MAG: hypothetical protein F4X75_02995 [Gemmatimonadetes bacterium]|nr:hypothetical protein [Gemmatimonadota bacterium]